MLFPSIIKSILSFHLYDVGQVVFKAKSKFPMGRFWWIFFLIRHITHEVISAEKVLITFLIRLLASDVQYTRTYKPITILQDWYKLYIFIVELPGNITYFMY